MFIGFVDALEADVPMEQALYFFVNQLAEMLYTDQAIKLVRVLHAEAARFPQLANVFDRAGPQRAHALLAMYFEQQIAKGLLRRVDALTAADHLIHMPLGEAFQRVLLGLSSSPSPKDVERRITTAIQVFTALSRTQNKARALPAALDQIDFPLGLGDAAHYGRSGELPYPGLPAGEYVVQGVLQVRFDSQSRGHFPGDGFYLRTFAPGTPSRPDAMVFPLMKEERRDGASLVVSLHGMRTIDLSPRLMESPAHSSAAEPERESH